jgi:SAM-dependent methyltransferase
MRACAITNRRVVPWPSAWTNADDWSAYSISDFNFVDFEPMTKVLDVGCGEGRQLEKLQGHGSLGVGVDPDRAALARCAGRGFLLVQARVEELPVRTDTVEGLICKAVVPYTQEARALGEIRRVLRPGGTAHCCYMGAGYYLRYLLGGPSWKFRVYGLRTLVNTWLFTRTGRRLPGFLGDTLYQSRMRLRRYYRELGLRLLEDCASPTFMTLPVFIYHRVQRTAHSSSTD